MKLNRINQNKNTKKRFIKPVLIGIVAIVALSIITKAINNLKSNSSLKVQSSNIAAPLVSTLDKENLKFKVDNRLRDLQKAAFNTKELKEKFYSETYLFHHLSQTKEINTYCATNVLSSAIALANCNMAAKMSNTLYLGYFALSDDSARFNVLTLLGALLVMFLFIKAFYNGMYSQNLQYQAKPVASSATGLES